MERKKEIIRLISQYGTITGKELARMVSCSLKTIQYTIKEINSEELIINSTSKGYELNDIYFSSNFSFENEENDINFLLSALLLREEKLDIDELSDEFYISRTTTERKLSNVKNVIKKYNLKIERQKNKIWLDGKEKDKRSLIASLISQEAENDFGRNQQKNDFLEGIDSNVIKNIVINIVNDNNYEVRECCMNGLLVNIAICLYRCKNGSNIDEVSEKIKENIVDETIISKQIYDEYSKHCSLNANDNDIYYLAVLLKGQISKKNDNVVFDDNKMPFTNDFIESIKEIIVSTFQYYGLGFDANNSDGFIYNFSIHVKAMIERARNNNKVENEMLPSIQKNCPFIYDVAVYIYNKIKDKYNVNISSEEIGYIAVHIGFLIERFSKNSINVLLLVSSYNGIDRIVKHKLKNLYGDGINIVADPNEFSKQGIDLVIMNHQKNIYGIKNVLISPFFDENDQDNVRQAINECIQIKNNLFTDVIYATFMSEKLFFRRNDLKTKDEVLKFMTNAMVEQGIVSDDFLASVIQREELSSTCFFDTFAIPHGMRFDAYKSRCSILISEDGIKWNDSIIHIVILIAVKYHDRHIFMKMYDNIIQSLQNKKRLLEVLSAESIDEFIEIVKK